MPARYIRHPQELPANTKDVEPEIRVALGHGLQLLDQYLLTKSNSQYIYHGSAGMSFCT
jgi:hypothetical protein